MRKFLVLMSIALFNVSLYANEWIEHTALSGRVVHELPSTLVKSRAWATDFPEQVRRFYSGTEILETELRFANSIVREVNGSDCALYFNNNAAFSCGIASVGRVVRIFSSNPAVDDSVSDDLPREGMETIRGSDFSGLSSAGIIYVLTQNLLLNCSANDNWTATATNMMVNGSIRSAVVAESIERALKGVDIFRATLLTTFSSKDIFCADFISRGDTGAGRATWNAIRESIILGERRSGPVTFCSIQ